MGYRTGFVPKPISAPSFASRGPQRYADRMAIFHLTHRTVGRSHRARIDRRSLVDQGITDRKSPGHEGPRPRQIEAKGRPAEKLTRIREARNTPGKPEQLHSAREKAAERERDAAWQLCTTQALDAATRRSERVVEGLQRVAEGIW